MALPLAVSQQPTWGPDRPHSGPPCLVTRGCPRGDTPAPQKLQVGPQPGVPQSPPGGGDRGHGTSWVRSQTPCRSLEPQAPGTTHRLMKGSPPGTRRGPLGHKHRLWEKAAEQPSSFLRSRTPGCTRQPAAGEGQEGDRPGRLGMRHSKPLLCPPQPPVSHSCCPGPLPFLQKANEEQADLSRPLRNGHKT